MAESQKKDCSSAGSEEKNSLLDLDIGKDFLSSWKSMSMAEGDVDFDLAPASKDNKKSFNFAKADMDFNLDGDFGNISSFNVDMSDLDISPPLKKDAQSKEKSKESSSGTGKDKEKTDRFGKVSSFNMDMSDLDISPPIKKDAQSKEKSKESSSGTGKDKEKTDRFTFAFDFDELEDFSFEPSLTKTGSKPQTDKNDTESAQNGTGCQDKEAPLHMNLIESMSTLANGSRKPSLTGTVNTFDMDCLPGGSVDFEPTRNNGPSNLGTDDAITSEHSTAIDDVASDKPKSYPETTIASREVQEISPSEKFVPLETIDGEAFTGNDALQDLPSDSHPNKEPIGGYSSESELKVDHVNMSAAGSNGEQDVNVAPTTDPTCNYKHALSGNSHHVKTVAISEKNNGENSQVQVDYHVMANIERTELGQVNPLVETSCTTSATSGIPCDTPSGRDNMKPAPEILRLPLVSQPADQSDKETENRSEPHITCSRYFMQSEKPEFSVQKPSIQTTYSSLSTKKMGVTPPTLGRRDLNNQSDRKLVSLPFQFSKTLLRRELPKTQDSCRGHKICGEANNADGLQNGEELNGSFTTQNKDMVKDRSALRQRETSMRDLDTLSSFAAIPHSSMEINKQAAQNRMDINKQTAQNRGNPITLASIPTMKSTSAEEHKVSSIEGDRKAPDLPGLKLSGLNLDRAKPPIRKDIKSVGNIGQNRISIRKAPLGIAPYLQKQAPSLLSMKRKAFQEDAAEVIALHPSKRLTQPPTASRDPMEAQEKVVDIKEANHNKLEKDRVKNAIDNSHVSTFHIPGEVTVKHVEISLSIGNDSNIKRAEGYNTELDDLCNMLRKKQDEAKELLAQAVVNSNKLLMLNSPRLEEKISFRLSTCPFHGFNFCITCKHRSVSLYYPKHSGNSEIFS